MAGNKRSHDGSDIVKISESSSPYISVFETFRTELDEHHDRRERVIKASRDITAQSKKMVKELGRSVHPSIKRQIEPMYSTIRDLFQSIIQDLQRIDAYRYQRNISGGIQEYLEAVLFQHYLETQQVMTLEEAAKTLPQGIMLTYEDYTLGLFDMTGELMRFAITYMATNGKLPGKDGGSASSSSILSDMQAMRSQLEALDVGGSYSLSRDFDAKLKTTRNSVEKVESGVYSMIVRGKERPKGWRPDTSTNETWRDNEEIESH